MTEAKGATEKVVETVTEIVYRYPSNYLLALMLIGGVALGTIVLFIALNKMPDITSHDEDCEDCN